MKTLSMKRALAGVPKPVRTLVTVRQTTLVEPRKLMAHEVREVGARPGVSARIGGAGRWRTLRTVAGPVTVHLGDCEPVSLHAFLLALRPVGIKGADCGKKGEHQGTETQASRP